MTKKRITAILAALAMTGSSIAVWGTSASLDAAFWDAYDAFWNAQKALKTYTQQTAGQAVTGEICRVQPEGPPRAIDHMPVRDNSYIPKYDRALPCYAHEYSSTGYVFRAYTDENSPAATILDDSYTPIHDRPVHCPHHSLPESPYPQDITVGGRACSYHDHLDEDSSEHQAMLTDIAKPCTECGGEMLLCDEFFYETAPCEHAVYFIGSAGKDCAHIRVHQWVFSCDCAEQSDAN